MCLLPPCPLWFIHILNNLTILATIKHLQVMAILRFAIPHFPWCLMIRWWSTIILPARWVKTCYDHIWGISIHQAAIWGTIRALGELTPPLSLGAFKPCVQTCQCPTHPQSTLKILRHDIRNYPTVSVHSSTLPFLGVGRLVSTNLDDLQGQFLWISQRVKRQFIPLSPHELMLRPPLGG